MHNGWVWKKGGIAVVGVEGTRMEAAWARLENYAGTRPPEGLPGHAEDMFLILRMPEKHHAHVTPPLNDGSQPALPPTAHFGTSYELLVVTGIRIILGTYFIHFRVVMRALQTFNILKRYFA